MKENKKTLKGGNNGRVIPRYNAPKTTPYKTNEEKEINTKRYEEAQKLFPKREQNNDPYIDLKIYDTQKPKPQMKPTVPPQLFVPIMTNGYNPYTHNQLYVPNRDIPVVKNYNIQTKAPFGGDFALLNNIFEDILPKKNYEHTFNTLGERLELYRFLKSTFVKKHEGEDKDLYGDDGLMKYLKLLKLNPYTGHNFTNNPYTNLPDDMLIYKSCYPIRHDKSRNNIVCAADSLGINVRLYRMKNVEKYLRNSKKGEYYVEYDVWRENIMYRYLRENIINRKVSPNFSLMYAYYICLNKEIDFDELNDVKKNGGRSYKPSKPYKVKSHIYKKKIEDAFDEDDNIIDPEKYSDYCILSLAESPTQNIFEWSSRSYQSVGQSLKMVNTGYHTKEEWLSVIFQIMSMMYIMQIHKIYISNFNIFDNIFIKDLKRNKKEINYWKYIVDNVEYYVPNYGYLAMFDSSYSDINLECDGDDPCYRIYSKIFTDPDNNYQNHKDGDDKFLEDKIFQNFLASINPDTYSNKFTDKGGVEPHNDVKILLGNIYEDASKNGIKDIAYYIKKYMTHFVHNRVGTYLNREEQNYIDNSLNLEKGSLLSYQESSGKNMVVLYIDDDDKNDTNIKIVKKNNPNDKDYIVVDVQKTSCRPFEKYKKLRQTFKPGINNLRESDLLETYIIKNEK